jgi:hypothetical protein
MFLHQPNTEFSPYKQQQSDSRNYTKKKTSQKNKYQKQS